MRLLAVNENTVYSFHGDWYCERQWPLVGIQLVREAGEGTLFTPVTTLTSPPSAALTKLDVTGVTIVNSGFVGGALGELQHRLFQSGRWRKAALAVVATHDFVLYRVPSPHLRYVAEACAALDKPLGLIVAAHRVKTSIGINRVPPLLRILARRYLIRQNMEQLSIGRRQAVIVFVNGAELLAEWQHVGNVVLWQDGHVTSEVFHERADTCTGHTKRLVRVCDLSEPRGVEVLLEAFRILCDDDPALVLDIVGDGSYTAYVWRLKRIASSIGDGSRVVFHGWCNKQRTIEIMRSADIQVISSYADAVPRVYLEGAANCLPLVATTVGGIPSFVRDGENGLLVPPGDPLRMADAIRRLLKDSSLRRRVIASGYHDALAWEMTQTQKRLMSLVSDAMAQAGKRASSADVLS